MLCYIINDKSSSNDFGLASRKIVGYAPPVEKFWVRHCAYVLCSIHGIMVYDLFSIVTAITMPKNVLFLYLSLFVYPNHVLRFNLC